MAGEILRVAASGVLRPSRRFKGDGSATKVPHRIARAVLQRLDLSACDLLLTRRGETLIALVAARSAPQRASVSGQDAESLLGGPIRQVYVQRLRRDGTLGRVRSAFGSSLFARHFPRSFMQVVTHLRAAEPRGPVLTQIGVSPQAVFRRTMDALRDSPGLVDFVHNAQWQDGTGAKTPQSLAAPFDDRADLPAFAPAEPKRRSVLFLHNSYYYFNCMSKGLRERGWDALTVSLEPPDSPQRQFYHGEDVNLHDPDPAVQDRKIRDFFRTVPERFGAVHFYGQGYATFFPGNVENDPDPKLVPWDFFELRRHRLIIGYTPSGCTDGARQSSIRRLSGDVCGRCIWELRPDVCSNGRSEAWAMKLDALCDWVGLEGDWAVDERTGPKFVRRPIITALDPQQWSPDIEVPADLRIDRAPGEVLVYHAVGNYEARRAAGRDIKGTGAVMAAIDRMRAEGVNVRLIFVHQMPSTKVRFLQVQADIVVDQLNYGRYGANARESLMLGRPVIGRVMPEQEAPLPPLQPLLETPVVNANEDSIYERLRMLVLDPDLRLRLGRSSRDFALRWHSSEVCALRFERVLDRVAAGLPAEADEVFA